MDTGIPLHHHQPQQRCCTPPPENQRYNSVHKNATTTLGRERFITNYTRRQSSIIQLGQENEATQGLVNWGVVYPK